MRPMPAGRAAALHVSRHARGCIQGSCARPVASPRAPAVCGWCASLGHLACCGALGSHMPARRGGGWALLSDSTSVQSLCECACMLPVSGALVRQCRRCPRLSAMACAVEQAWRNVCKAPAHSNGLCFVFKVVWALRHCSQQHRRTWELIKSMLVYGLKQSCALGWTGAPLQSAVHVTYLHAVLPRRHAASFLCRALL